LVAELKGNDLILSRKARIYVFGSILRKTSAISDVDIAVIVKPSIDPGSVKTSLETVGRYFPLDVIYMTDVEEEEFEFLAGQQAVNIFDEWLTIGSTRTPNSSLFALRSSSLASVSRRVKRAISNVNRTFRNRH